MRASLRPVLSNASRRHLSGADPVRDGRTQRLRASTVILGMGLAFGAVGLQLARLAFIGGGGSEMSASLNEAIPTSFARPDIIDRNGRLLATDIQMPSLFADPAIVQNRDEAVEKLATVLPGLDEEEMRRVLSDRARRFTWLRRGLSPKLAQSVHDLGLPGLAFRDELKRAYPLERLAGHVLGIVNVDNRGIQGLERFIDDAGRAEAVHGATISTRVPVRLSLDIGVEHALEDELRLAVGRYDAKAASGLVMDITSGEMLASASLPGADPLRPQEMRDPARADRVQGGVFELGSIWKTMTIAMALETGVATLDRVIDVTQPLAAGRFTITDTHPAGRPLSVAEIFIHSSNVGAGMLALDVGVGRQTAFLERLGLMGAMKTEVGPVAPPLLPARFERAEQITVAYGHGIAVAPIQFAAAAAALLNGGEIVTPTYLHTDGAGTPAPRVRVVSEATSRSLREIFRRNVTDAHGTGRRADVPGYRVGGKTGTAEMPGRGGYREKAVISSFIAAFPMDQPRYLVLVSLFEPKGTEETGDEITAGRNAAPTAGRVISRIAPILGVMPEGAVAALPD